jgi:hypothetical protein
MEKILKVIFAILLFGCLADMSYGYFQFVRFAGMGLFAFLAFKEFEQGNQNLAFVYVLLAILFQPFFKISLGRELWNVVDVIVGIGLLVDAFSKKGSQS